MFIELSSNNIVNYLFIGPSIVAVTGEQAGCLRPQCIGPQASCLPTGIKVSRINSIFFVVFITLYFV